MDKRRMQRYYRAMLWEVSLIVWWDPDRINKELKTWYNILTTTRMNPEEYYEYIDYTINMFAEMEILFDSDRYKFEWVSYTFLFDRLDYGTHRNNTRTDWAN